MIENGYGYLSKLKQERERLYKVFDSLPAFVYLQDQNHNIHFANKTFIKRFGHPKEGPCHRLIAGRDTPCKECYAEPVFENGEPKAWEKILVTGECYDIHVLPFSHDDNNPLVLVFGFNITDRRRAEQEISRLDRLNLIGEMAAGIAHEVRNPLTTVRGFLQLLEAKDGLNEFESYFSLMIDELDRANSIITEFLSLAKNKKTNFLLANVNTLITSLSPLLEAQAHTHDIGLSIELQELPLLLIDEKEIRQMILNLVRNAIESMPNKGSVTIRTYKEASSVILSVKDQGKGIDEEIMDKLGTPFISTKENGTGLGLSICYSIAARHKAELQLATSPEGTTIQVIFPIPSPQG